MPLTHKVSRSTLYLLIMIYLSMFVMMISTMLYARHISNDSNKKWCGILSVYHDAYNRNSPPATQAGKDIQAQLEKLYRDFKCVKYRGMG
jgi:hypothetical protein